jgi:hypothetical protein
MVAGSHPLRLGAQFFPPRWRFDQIRDGCGQLFDIIDWHETPVSVISNDL